MTFNPRTFEQIRDAMISYIKLNTELTDFEIGSVIRTLIEACALEDDNQYFQMVELLDSFKISTATGQDLTDRGAEFDLSRLLPQSATTSIVLQDGGLKTSFTLVDLPSLTTSFSLVSTANFPTSGYPYTVRIGEGTLNVEDLSVSNNNTSTNTLTTSALANRHAAGERVSFVSGSSDVVFSPGLAIQKPATPTQSSVNFITTGSGILINGNYQSTAITARAQVPGSSGNLGTGEITKFTSAIPFTNALVTNITDANGGTDLESDESFRSRIINKKQTLSTGNSLALEQASLGIINQATGQKVVSASVVQDYANDEVIVYIDDGTGFTPSRVALPTTTLAAGYGIGVSTIVVNDITNFPSSGAIIISPSGNIEVIKYTAVNYSTGAITLAAVTTATHSSGDEVAVVDVLNENTLAGLTYFNTDFYPIVRSSERVWVNQGSGYSILPSTSYFLNKGQGQFQLKTPLAVGSTIVTNYTYYTGLVQQVQKVLEGDPFDKINFPGVKSSGESLVVETPLIRRITVNLTITTTSDSVKSDLISKAQESIEIYISSLGVGATIILAEIINRVMSIQGILNVVVSTPTSDIYLLQNELPLAFDSAGNSLVTVN